MSETKHKFFLSGFSAVFGLSLLLTGAGCFQTADETAGTVINGAVKTPLVALDKAKQLSVDEKARQNRQAEEMSNYVTVALILTEGSEQPPDAMEIGPTVGCNDRAAFIQTSRASDSGQVAIDALNSLFAMKESSYKGLYNALAFSTLKTADQAYTTDGQNVEIRIEGQVVGGGACDLPRIKAEIEETVRRFHPNFKIFLNGTESAWRCLGDMSGQCK